ncbi:MAG: M48 family metalloprotease [Paracoccaceae bacterium]
MTKLLLPLLLIGGLVFWMRIQSQASGAALRNGSRPLANDQLEALVGRLAKAAGVEHVDIRVLPDRNVNGLATGTGEIYITQGLLDVFRSSDVTAQEIASVAAHEMGHLALGHMKRRMVEVAGRQAAQMVLGGVVARIIPFFGAHVVHWVLNLLTAGLSRRDEFEADAYATALMVRSGIGAEHQASMLEKLPALVPGAAQGQSWLASHPPVEERARAIRENADRWAGSVPSIEQGDTT